MMLTHEGHAPAVDASAWVAPNAAICGNVTIGPGTRIMHGAQIISEGAHIVIGATCIVMQNAVIRATARHPMRLGHHCLVGPSAHIVGADIDDQVFIATGAALFHGCHVGRGGEVRIHGVVHVKTRLAPGATVPIGWIAVGDPAALYPPEAHDKIWARQEPLDFPGEVYGVDRHGPEPMIRVTEGLSARLAAHVSDEPI